MSIFVRYIIFILSFILFALFLYTMYLRGKRRGIKKALYKVSFRSMCLIIAFLLTPYLNEFIMNFDLDKVDMVIHVEGMYFYRIIDFIEEVIAHNEALNEIYNYFPALKNLLMDFPQVIFIPFTFVLTYLTASFLLTPFYMFMSYRRKRRVLYEKGEYSKASKTWAGILYALQSVVVICIIVTPLSGLTRVYKESKKGLIEDESNICQKNEALGQYSYVCDIVEGYNSSIIGMIGANPVSEYMFKSFTRISYNDKDTSLSNELISISKAGILLNKTGLLNAINVEGFDDVSQLDFTGLTNEEIDIMIDSFESSAYTQAVLEEVYDWASQYLGYLIKANVDEEFKPNFKDVDLKKELKIVLRAINYVINNEEMLSDVKKVVALVNKYLEIEKKERRTNDGIRLFFNIVYSINVDNIIELFNMIKDSQIYRQIIPQMLEHLFKTIDTYTTISKYPEELNDVVIYALNVAKIIQHHKYTYDILTLIADLTRDELAYIGQIAEYVYKSNSLSKFFNELGEYGLKDANLEMDIPLDLAYKITDWTEALCFAQVIIRIVRTGIYYEKPDWENIRIALFEYTKNEIYPDVIKFGLRLLPDVFVMLLTGKDGNYLVGEYVNE